MASVDIIFNGTTTTIQCNENEKIEDIIKKFCIKVEKRKDEIGFLYGGVFLEENKTFNEVANLEDKERKKMSILVTEKNATEPQQDSILKKSKYIICPKCEETITINIKDFKIKIFDCKNKHNIENLSFSDFNKSQLYDESKIICESCKNVNKSETYNNSFFKCNTCNKNICPLCKSSHDKNHIIIDYDQQFFKCKLHNDLYNLYCNDCNQNICILCEKDHNNHKTLSLGKIIPDISKLEEDKNNFKIIADKCKNDIEGIINKLKNVISNIDLYYNIYNDIMEGYAVQNRNYQILKNINYMNNNSHDFTKELNTIIDATTINSKFDKILILYDKINLNNKIQAHKDEKIKSEPENNKKESKKENQLIKDIKEDIINNINLFKIKEYNNGRYVGEFRDGKKEGRGIYYYKSGSRYEGEYKNGKYNGKGIYYYNSGNKYEGEYKNGKAEGKGIYYYKNGDRYEGEFKDNKIEGKGIYYYNNGDREMGDYLNNKPIGKHCILTNNGDVKNKVYTN